MRVHYVAEEPGCSYIAGPQIIQTVCLPAG